MKELDYKRRVHDTLYTASEMTIKFHYETSKGLEVLS